MTTDDGARLAQLPPVLMYHSVSGASTPDPNHLRVHPQRLDAQLRGLRRLGLHGVSLGELLSALDRGSARRLVGLTFDDGYTDFLEQAIPVLDRHGMTATVYIVAGHVAGTNDWDEGPRLPLLDADQIRRVAGAGHEVGSHGLTHIRLAALDAETLRTEINESRRILEDVIDRPVRGFCYPYGDFDAAAADVVREAGYDHACVTKDYSSSDRFTYPRFYIGQKDGVLRLTAKLAVHSARRRSAGRGGR